MVVGDGGGPSGLGTVGAALEPFPKRPWLHLGRMLRYSAVSAVTLPLGQLFLVFCLVVLDWSAVTANLAAVSAGAVPSYLLNRYWVWSKKDKNSFRTEILPFWAMMVLGLAISTLLSWYAGRNFDSPLAVNAANLIGFGLVWVFKFFVLDRVVFTVVAPGTEVVGSEPVP